MLAPLLLVWPITIVLTYGVAEGLSQTPFDRVLEDQVHALSRQVRWEGDVSYVNLPPAARNILRADDTDQIYFQIRSQKNRILAGDPDLSIPDDDDPKRLSVVSFRSEELADKKIRIAHLWVAPPDDDMRTSRWVLVQVAETLGKRTQLATEIVKGMVLPQFIVLPISVLLVWFGLSRGIRPLNTLQDKIQQRKPDDLSPIPLNEVPEELSPVVVSFNDLLLRLDHNMAVQKRFVADAAHQLKTPLAGLRIQAELAHSAQTEAERTNSLNNITRGSRQATRLVNQLLALARTEAQATQGSSESLPKQRVDLSELAREVTLEWIDEALHQGHDLGLEADAPAWVMGNVVLLKELLKNLIDNALTYTPAPGTITVRITQHDADAQTSLEVEDTGIGIAPTERAAVLQPFYRVLGTGKDGSGLGLAIVQHIVSQHHAHMHLLDNPRAHNGHGLLVSIVFESPVLTTIA